MSDDIILNVNLLFLYKIFYAIIPYKIYATLFKVL